MIDRWFVIELICWINRTWCKCSLQNQCWHLRESNTWVKKPYTQSWMVLVKWSTNRTLLIVSHLRTKAYFASYLDSFRLMMVQRWCSLKYSTFKRAALMATTFLMIYLDSICSETLWDRFSFDQKIN